MLVDLCWWANKRDEDPINVATLKLTDQRPWLPLGHMHLVLIRSGIINPAVSSKEKCWSPNGHLFSLTLSYLDAVPGEKKESNFLCLFTCTFLFSMTFSPRTRNPDKRRIWTKQSLCKIMRAFEWRWLCWTLRVVFSHSVTGIVKSPVFKRWIRACINTLLICFLIHKFVIWSIFHFPVLWFCLKVQVAGVQAYSSQGKSPAPSP